MCLSVQKSECFLWKCVLERKRDRIECVRVTLSLSLSLFLPVCVFVCVFAFVYVFMLSKFLNYSIIIQRSGKAQSGQMLALDNGH